MGEGEATRYDILFRGELLPGQTVEAAKADLVAKVGLAPEDGLWSKGKLVVSD